MNSTLTLASVSITGALVFYTMGVFAERKAGKLTVRSLLMFWIGLAFDATGTTLMGVLARSDGGGAAQFGAHAVTGALAIVLMGGHALWAAWVYFKGSERSNEAFHRFSTVVWLVWLVPYVMGMLIGIPAIGMRPVCAAGTSVLAALAVAMTFLIPKTRLRHGVERG